MAVTVNLGSARRVLSGALVIALAATVLYGALAYSEGYFPFGQRDDQWSGVFLTNGQAYFGHYHSGPGDYAVLREVYYVLATQLQSQDPNVRAQTQLTLQRLGGEIHGPKQEMRIAKAQILFVEDLRPDSPLVASIARLKSGATPAPQAPVQPAPATGAPATTAPATPTRALTPSPSPTR
jgi:hypothetical protein